MEGKLWIGGFRGDSQKTPSRPTNLCILFIRSGLVEIAQARVPSSFRHGFCPRYRPCFLNENPPPESEIKAVLPQFKYLGIELGKPWKRESVNPLILAQMKQAAQEIGPMALGTMPL